jgi:hypothetical protein
MSMRQQPTNGEGSGAGAMTGVARQLAAVPTSASTVSKRRQTGVRVAKRCVIGVWSEKRGRPNDPKLTRPGRSRNPRIALLPRTAPDSENMAGPGSPCSAWLGQPTLGIRAGRSRRAARMLGYSRTAAASACRGAVPRAEVAARQLAPAPDNSHRNRLPAYPAAQSDSGPNDPKLTRPGRRRNQRIARDSPSTPEPESMACPGSPCSAWLGRQEVRGAR